MFETNETTDQLEARLEQWGAEETASVDPAFANRLETDLRMMSHEQAAVVASPSLLRSIVGFSLLGILAMIGAFTLLRSTATDPVELIVPPADNGQFVEPEAATTTTTAPSTSKLGTTELAQAATSTTQRSTEPPALPPDSDPEVTSTTATTTEPPTSVDETTVPSDRKPDVQLRATAFETRVGLRWSYSGSEEPVAWEITVVRGDHREIIAVLSDSGARAHSVERLRTETVTYQVIARRRGGEQIAISNPASVNS